MEAQVSQRVSERVVKPFIVFKRTVNKGIRTHTSKTKDGTEHVTQLGEHVQNWKCVLTDKKGELCPWATVLGMQQYIAKGYLPIELGGFQEYFARKDSNQDMVKELHALYIMLNRSVNETNELEALRKENDDLRAKLAEALAASSDPALKAQLEKLQADLDAQIKARGDDEERLKKLQAEMAAQADELEKAREAEKKKAAAADKAQGK